MAAILVVAAALLPIGGAKAVVFNPADAPGGYNGTLSIVTTPSLSPINSWYSDNLGGPGSDIANQNASTIATFLSGLGVSGTINNITGMSADSLSGHSVTVSGAGADIFAIHFGGPGGGQELIFQFASLVTSFQLTLGCPVGNSNCDGKFDLSNIRAFDNITTGGGPTRATPLPAALPLFAGGLGVLGVLGLLVRRRKNKVAVVL